MPKGRRKRQLYSNMSGLPQGQQLVFQNYLNPTADQSYKMPQKKATNGKKSKRKALPRKRGRKPKGGKIIAHLVDPPPAAEEKFPNSMLHLKCSRADLPLAAGGLTSYTPPGRLSRVTPYCRGTAASNVVVGALDNKGAVFEEGVTVGYGGESVDAKQDKRDMKEIWHKLRQLKRALHGNDISDKRSACFHCAHQFDNPPVHIPKEERHGIVEVYGCFCSPECAVAYLRKEMIDSSTRWERYALLNSIYSKIYNYEKNIKPAPDPHYTLDNYYGNLSISDYRHLFRNDRLLLIVNKPLTKVLPELYEDNNDTPAVYANLLDKRAVGAKPRYRLQRKLKRVSKKSILTTKFNFAAA